MEELNDFFRYGHHEAIVTSMNMRGKVNIAPMGVDLHREYLVLKPFTNTETFKNILEVKEAVINLTNDSIIFYNALLSKENLKFVPSKKVKPPRIDGYVDYYIECTVEGINLDKEKLRAIVFLKPVYIEKGKGSSMAYSRSNSFIIEMLIYFTKVKAFIDLGNVSGAYKALQEVVNYYIKITRLGSPKIIEIAKDILNRSLRLCLNSH